MAYYKYMDYKLLPVETKKYIAIGCFNNILSKIHDIEDEECDYDEITQEERDYRHKMIQSPSETMSFWMDWIRDTNKMLPHINVVYNKYSYRSIFDLLLKDMGLFEIDPDSLNENKRTYMVRDFHPIPCN